MSPIPLVLNARLRNWFVGRCRARQDPSSGDFYFEDALRQRHPVTSTGLGAALGKDRCATKWQSVGKFELSRHRQSLTGNQTGDTLDGATQKWRIVVWNNRVLVNSNSELLLRLTNCHVKQRAAYSALRPLVKSGSSPPLPNLHPGNRRQNQHERDLVHVRDALRK